MSHNIGWIVLPMAGWFVAPADSNVPLVDVLLFSTVHQNVRPSAVEPSSFRLVIMHVRSVGGDGFIQL